MLLHATAPGSVPAPLLYARYTWVKELAIPWGETGPPLEYWEITLLVKLVNTANETQARKARVKAAGRGKHG